MTLRRGPTGTIRRVFDDGSALVFRDSVEEPKGIGFREAYCKSPGCACRDVSVALDRLEWPADAEGPRPVGAPAQAVLDLDTGSLLMDPEEEQPEDAGFLLERARQRLGSGLLDLFRERWNRVKHLADDDEWRRVDWSGIELDWMVRYHELFPSRWDLAAETEQGLFWLVDSWCLGRVAAARTSPSTC